MRFGGVERLVPGKVDELAPGKLWGRFVVVRPLGRVSCFLPARLMIPYSHAWARFAQRAHVGFSLLHFTFEAAQAWQLSRNLGAVGTVDRRPDARAGRVGSPRECTAAIID